MIRSKGEAGTGNVVEAVRHMREITAGIKRLAQLGREELAGRRQGATRRRSRSSARSPTRGRLPVPLFCAGGIATPADAALMMQLGAEGNFVGSGIFKSADPERRAKAIVEATTHFNDPERVAAASIGLGEAMRGPRDRRRWRPPDALLQDRGSLTCASASSPSRATSPRTCEMLRRARRRSASRCARRSDLEGLDGLVIPGGESTTITMGIESAGLEPAIRAHHEAGRPILGTCAGMIVCDAEHLGFIDATARRNAFGRQLQSFEADLEVDGDRRRAAARGLHPRPLDRAPRRGGRGAGRPARATRWRSARAACSPAPSTPS